MRPLRSFDSEKECEDTTAAYFRCHNVSTFLVAPQVSIRAPESQTGHRPGQTSEQAHNHFTQSISSFGFKFGFGLGLESRPHFSNQRGGLLAPINKHVKTMMIQEGT